MEKKRGMPIIRFMPMEIDVPAGEGEFFLGEVARRIGLVIDQPCGGLGTCGKCRVIVHGASSAISEQEKRMLSPREIDSGYRLACRCPVEEGLTVFVDDIPSKDPGRGKGFEEPIRYGKRSDPLVKCVSFFPAMPGVHEKISSLSEVAASLLDLPAHSVPLSLMGSLQKAFTTGNRAKAVLSGNRLVALEAGDSFKPWGLAIDLGTTSLVMWLADLEDGTAVDAISEINPQVSYGADVLTRLSHIANRREGLAELRGVLISELNRMAGSLARTNGVSREHICAVVAAGNTCMEHIFAGVDPTPVGKSPFIPPFRSFPRLDACSLGLDVAPLAEVAMVPNISGYVGGDITAGIEASGMCEESEVTLFVDIGTNSEIVLGNRDFLISCSAAAGPAFEGARVSCGMRAAVGAIERVSVNGGRFRFGVIGGVSPVGICGSGIVDLVSEMMRHGLVDATGKIVEGPGPDQDITISVDEGGMKHIVLAGSMNDRDAKKLIFTQKDVREVQLAKGAIATGVQALLENKGLDLDDLDRVIVGGAFGNYLNPANAISIGVLPRVPLEKVKYLGNTSIMGAFHGLISRRDHDCMEEISRRTEYLELSTLQDFQARFLSNLRLGHASSDKV